MCELLTADELGERLRVRPDTIKIWARDGIIPSVRITGKVVRYDFADVIAKIKGEPPPVEVVCPAR